MEKVQRLDGSGLAYSIIC